MFEHYALLFPGLLSWTRIVKSGHVPHQRADFKRLLPPASRLLYKPANSDNSHRQHRHQIYDCSCMQILRCCFKVCRREAGCMSCMHRDVERRDDSPIHVARKLERPSYSTVFARLVHALLSLFQALSEFCKLQSAFTISLLLHRSSQTCPMLSSLSCLAFALVCSIMHASQAIAIAVINGSGSPD
jgi:hypothetical protein